MNYRREVVRTLEARPQFDSLAYAALNIGGEGGEVIDILKKHLCTGEKLDKDHLIEELGDLLWSIEVLCIKLHIDRSQIELANIKKLRDRFGIVD